MTVAASTSEIRHWARGQGMTVGDRGRLPPEILTVYAASQSEAVGVGPHTAATLLVTVGDNPERLRNEATFAEEHHYPQSDGFDGLARQSGVRSLGSWRLQTCNGVAAPPGGSAEQLQGGDR